ncbi:MAG: phosphate ABC transporter permease subunit PstC [Puniceicoccales bacterium]|jgi:phosphate transport system permease protein|nr:phosphate ABC transporter permease subunit PstC [Puniceicoccales bacterium]
MPPNPAQIKTPEPGKTPENPSGATRPGTLCPEIQKCAKEAPPGISPICAPPDAPGTFSCGPPRRRWLRWLTFDNGIRAFFGANALTALVVLSLIVIFLFREGGGFFAQNHDSIVIHRKAGLEFVDILRRVETEHSALNRLLLEIRVEGERNGAPEERLKEVDRYSETFADAILPVRSLISDLGEEASAVKAAHLALQDRLAQRAQLLAAGKKDEAGAVDTTPVNFAAGTASLTRSLPACREALLGLSRRLSELLAATPLPPVPAQAPQMKRFRRAATASAAALPEIEAELGAWDPEAPVSWHGWITTFLTGREWLTASFWQDWYGVLPLLAGSLLVSFIALAISVPFALAAAVYVNQLASERERRAIKPAIEFIAAIPSVVLGFFGIAVLGSLLRDVSQAEWLAWVPGFPAAERLNALTAGVLLALVSIPAIFTLAEDALDNVPMALREASFALGASRLQTIVRVVIPAALSGILSAVLLGFGRVVGETMIVLLCAGNRIAIPDFGKGLMVVTQPVHTMTGIIAQEMGEVASGSIHYRALFVVGIVLFLLSLLINATARRFVARRKAKA